MRLYGRLIAVPSAAVLSSDAGFPAGHAPSSRLPSASVPSSSTHVQSSRQPEFTHSIEQLSFKNELDGWRRLLDRRIRRPLSAFRLFIVRTYAVSARHRRRRASRRRHRRCHIATTTSVSDIRASTSAAGHSSVVLSSPRFAADQWSDGGGGGGGGYS